MEKEILDPKPPVHHEGSKGESSDEQQVEEEGNDSSEGMYGAHHIRLIDICKCMYIQGLVDP